MREQDDEAMSRELAEAIDLLRRPAAVRPEWREELLRRAATPEPIAIRPRRVSLSVPWAVAAGIACALIGAGAVTMLRDSSPSPAVVAEHQPRPSEVILLPVRFTLAAPHAGQVSIVGDFNDWNPTTLPMRRSADGRVWEVEVRLPTGRYNYAFMVDGRFARDPGAPSTTDDDFGTPNSVLMVRGS